MAKNIHVVFGLSCKLLLEHSFSIAPHVAGEVLCLIDDLRIGPINALNTAEGLAERKRWFDILGEDDFTPYSNQQDSSDYQTIESVKELLQKGQLIYIWYGNNSYDLLSLGRLLESIQNYRNQLILVPVSQSVQVSLRNLTFVPTSLAQLRIDQIPTLEEYFRTASELELKTLTEIWSSAIRRAETLRMVNAKGEFQDNVADKINQVLISFCKKDYQKSAIVIAHTLASLSFEAADFTLNWMLKMLVVDGKIEAKGTLRAIREYEVRIL